MRTTVPGSARTVLLAALALAAAAMVTAIAVMATRSDSTVDPAARPDEATTPLGSGRADPAGRRRPIDPGEEGETDDGDEWEPRGQPGGSRDPEGPVFVVTADTLRAEFAVRHWEEVRRMIDVLPRAEADAERVGLLMMGHRA